MEKRPEGNEFAYAGGAVRFLARVLDILILALVLNVLYAVDRWGASKGWWPPMPGPRYRVAGESLSLPDLVRAFFYGGIWPLYYVVFHSLGGQTPGKMAFSIRVLSRDGADPSPWQILLRLVGEAISSFFFLGYLPILFTRTKRGLHDLIAGTVVVKKE
ncbi:MAG: RDD family protein [Deltaproteobacteria bacterium]|nr:MAG: RDD family protein [Deltaproteobacteria bacterium]